MDWQKIIEHSIALLFPLIIVFLFVYYMLKAFFDQFEKQRKQEFRMRFADESFPIRLQAYERLVLFLERIKPESMIMRVAKPDMNTFDMQNALLSSIREEYEHNLSQQIYVSPQAWAMICAARQSMVQLISSTASDHKPEDQFSDYATDILEEYASISDDPLTLAIRFLQAEAKEML